jgi:hypothetical protein
MMLTPSVDRTTRRNQVFTAIEFSFMNSISGFKPPAASEDPKPEVRPNPHVVKRINVIKKVHRNICKKTQISQKSDNYESSALLYTVVPITCIPTFPRLIHTDTYFTL